MKKVKLTETQLTEIIGKVINEQEVGEQTRNLDRVKSTSTDSDERNEFLTAYSEMQDNLYNMHFLDKKEVMSHNANEIIIGYRKNIKEIERRMENMCKQYDIARRAMKRFEDDWVMVGSYSKK